MNRSAILPALTSILSGLTQKSTVIGYATLGLGVFGVSNTALAARIGGLVALVASVVLFVLQDKSITSLFIAPKIAPTVPAPKESPMSLLSDFDTIRSDLEKAAPVVEALIPVVEAIVPSAATKIGAVEALAKAVLSTGIVADAEGVWAILKPLVEKSNMEARA